MAWASPGARRHGSSRHPVHRIAVPYEGSRSRSLRAARREGRREARRTRTRRRARSPSKPPGRSARRTATRRLATGCVNGSGVPRHHAERSAPGRRLERASTSSCARLRPSITSCSGAGVRRYRSASPPGVPSRPCPSATTFTIFPPWRPPSRRRRVLFVANSEQPDWHPRRPGAVERLLRDVPSEVIVVMDEAYSSTRTRPTMRAPELRGCASGWSSCARSRRRVTHGAACRLRSLARDHRLHELRAVQRDHAGLSCRDRGPRRSNPRREKVALNAKERLV